MNYSIVIDFLKDCDPIVGKLIDRVGACQLHQHENVPRRLSPPASAISAPATTKFPVTWAVNQPFNPKNLTV